VHEPIAHGEREPLVEIRRRRVAYFFRARVNDVVENVAGESGRLDAPPSNAYRARRPLALAGRGAAFGLHNGSSFFLHAQRSVGLPT
jgi:hypothetical protein